MEISIRCVSVWPRINNQRFYIPFELRVVDDSSIDFFFDPSDYPKLADPAMILMPWEKDAEAFSIADKFIEQHNLVKNKIYSDVKTSSLSLHHDRALCVSSRSVPITGTMLNSFGSFLDYKFREYDYYAGVYDATILSTKNLCELHYSSSYQSELYCQCFDEVSKRFYEYLGFEDDPRARYVFARLAQHEYGREKLLRFAYRFRGA